MREESQVKEKRHYKYTSKGKYQSIKISLKRLSANVKYILSILTACYTSNKHEQPKMKDSKH